MAGRPARARLSSSPRSLVLALALGAACSGASHEAPVKGPQAAEQPAPVAQPAPEAVHSERAAPSVLADQAKPAPAPAIPAVERADASDAEWAAEIGDPKASTSQGSPTNGSLVGGVALPKQGVGFRHNDRRDENARFATVEVIRAMVRAARVVHADHPGSELVINDVGLPAGGRIAHHGSHRSGRDADILFYLRGDDGKYTPSVGAPIDPDGIGFDFKDLSIPADDVRVHFDAERTWRFVEALLSDPEARIQRIFVAEHLRSMLLDAAQKRKASADVITRFSAVTCQPSYPHDDHLHVRWYCSAEDIAQGCEDLPPIYPWHREELAALGLSPRMASQVRSKDPAPIETNEDAERAVKRQKPHKSVLSFLARRKAWEKQPHPGREYCK